MVKVLSVNGKIPLVDGKAISATGGGSSTVELDTTLTQSGKAADAKAVGDALADKQNTISDLEAIRSGAAKGATALQIVPNTYRTAEAQDVIDSGKQDKLIAGENITIAEDGKTISATNPVPKPLTYDYMPEGYPSKSVQTTTLMEEQEVEFTLSDGYYMASITNAFEIVVGQTYTVKWDGTEYECVGATAGKNMYVLGNLSMAGAGADTGEPFLYLYSTVGAEAVGQFGTFDTSASHTISVKKIVETVTPMAEEYLPENLATKSDVEATQKVLDGVFSSVATFTFDKQTSGRDTFVYNAYDYYKISDFNPSPSDVISFKGTSESGDNQSEILVGNNCVEYGDFIVVASAGDCSLLVTDSVFSFTAPSAGLYASYSADNPSLTAGTGEFTLRVSTGSFSITGLLLKSSTANSTKKFKITVDDTGALSATEVTA